MKKYKFTRKMMKLLSKVEMQHIEGTKISFNTHKTKMDDCIVGEESIIISIFSSALNNKKYFKEIK